MIQCPRCSAAVPTDAAFCPACGAQISSVSQLPTAFDHAPAAFSTPHSAHRTSGGSVEAPYAPGEVLAGRYRIVGLLGRGGMGEVFRADDLKLGQPVALKFLPRLVSSDPARLERFHAEVRNAREVSHPHVCRVYDIGEVNGQHFLSMEYVDGEDLATLLRRIGRLPPAKAIEIARQLCAGLAAAHERGVIHRDLKPANIMIDGHGRARITDFGLAVRGEDAGGEVAGTPAYMSPEQLSSQPATVRSDLYSLGMVLYEVFTGKRAFEAASFAEWHRKHSTQQPTHPSVHTRDMDPAVERVILRCLEKDPARRPASAAQVALALPGGDPLAAAIAAGETPSPEMVAAAGGEGALSPRAAWTLLGGALAVIVSVVLLSPHSTDLGLAPMESSPAVLRARAREIVARFGYGKNPADSAEWLRRDYDALLHFARNVPSPVWRRKMREIGTPILYFYRQSPRAMIPLSPDAQVRDLDPPQEVSGMVSLSTDSLGRLRGFRAVPPQVEPAGATEPFDWSSVFTEAGLDENRFKETAPQWLPPVPFDARAEWTGDIPELPEVPLRVTAAAHRGKLVYFELLGPWSKPARMSEPTRPAGLRIGDITLTLMVIALITAGTYYARRNLRHARGDRKGAFRLTVFVASLSVILWALRAHHAGSLPNWFGLLFWPGIASSLAYAGTHWLMYMAIEPYVRRRMPQLLIGWARVLEGKIRDARVGRDVLSGILIGACMALVAHLVNGLPTWFPLPGQTTIPPSTLAGSVPPNAFANFVNLLLNALIQALSIFSVYFLLRSFLKRNVPSAIGVGIIALLLSLGGENMWLEIPGGVITAILVTVCIVRFGLLACVAMWVAFLTLVNLPIWPNMSLWYAAIGVPCLIVLVGLAVYAFRISLGKQPVFGAASLDD